MQLLDKISFMVHFDSTAWFILITTNFVLELHEWHTKKGLLCVSIPSGPPQKSVKCHIWEFVTVTSIMAQNDILRFSEKECVATNF